MSADNDIVERLRALSRREHDDLSIGDEAAAEIVRLRGEVAERADDLTAAYMAGRYDGKAIAPAEAKGDAWAVADAVIAEAYPDFNGRGAGYWGDQRIPNYGILRGAIVNALRPQPADGGAVAVLHQALAKIARWELPETGETWPSGGAVSYEAAFGSQGVRIYFQKIAREAIAYAPPATQVQGEAVAHIVHMEDAPTNVHITEAGMSLGYGRWPVYLEAAHPSACELGAVRDSRLLDWLHSESWKLDPFNIPTGAGDHDIGWRVIEYHGDAPHERVVAEVYTDDPRSALESAAAALQHRGDSRGGEG